MTEFLTQEEFQRNCALLERVRPLLQRIESNPRAGRSFRMTLGLTDGVHEVKVCGMAFHGNLEGVLQAAVNYVESL